jgi:uncharacterized protein YbcC (UPF0753/DUF2309 family)
MSTLIAQPLPFTATDLRLRLRHALEHAAHLLPAQGPIGVFIHHNTLHAFQHMPFEEAVVAAAEVYGTEPFMTEQAYREQFSLGRITGADVAAVLQQERNEPILPGRLDRQTLRYDLLCFGPRRFDPLTIQWHLEETDLLRRFRRDLNATTMSRLLPASAGPEEAEVRALFSACTHLPSQRSHIRPHTRPARSFEDAGLDPDEHVHPLLIRLCAAFLDQGMAYWPMPDRDLGFLNSARVLLSRRWALFPAHLDQLATEFRRQHEAGTDADAVVLEMLQRLGVAPDEFDSAIQSELLLLPGWAGIMYRLEMEPELAPHRQLPCSLMEFLAVRLTLKAVAAESLAGRYEFQQKRQPVLNGSFTLAQAASRFDALQILGFGVREMGSLNPIVLEHLIEEIDCFDQPERRRLLHLAYEHNHESGILKPLVLYRRDKAEAAIDRTRPTAQIFFCIDEREESMRRHIEEIAPEIETHSAAGFFGVAIDYAGIDDAHGVALCPVVVKPQHAVRERPFEEHRPLHESRRTRRKIGAVLTQNTAIASRSLVRGWVSTSALGGVALLPLLMRVLAPARYGWLKEFLHRQLVPQPSTELDFVRAENGQLVAAGELLQGFSITEMTDRVAGVLGPAGLRDGFARLVVILGHGSTSLNNPHESAHDCGACGGRRGGPNGRLFAAMANHPAVRTALLERGIRIPADTWFVGGYHDTCNDAVDLYDLDFVPVGHSSDLGRVTGLLNRARALDAEERARRFEAARQGCGPDQALKHVQERAQHLAEPRPEYGHATNAVCIVGRRSLTKGLFMDRRSFLVSYDATVDPADEGLARLLGAAGPVCAGINLEYYF